MIRSSWSAPPSQRFLLVDGQRFHLRGRFGRELAGKVGLALSKQAHRAVER